MGVVPGTLLSDPVTIGDTGANTFGSHYDFQGIGGLYCVPTLSELNAIPVNPSPGILNQGDILSSGRRRLGMTVFVLSENKYYKLYDASWDSYITDLQRYNSLADNLNWIEAFSSGAGVFMAGGTNNNAIKSIFGTNSLEGDYSLAGGNMSKAIGAYAHAWGLSVNAWRNYATAEGNNSITTGLASHAEGENNNAYADYSHAEGRGTVTGRDARNFTVSGTTITIAGDVTADFANGLSVFFFNINGGTASTYTRTISASTYNGVNTTFTINAVMPGVISGFAVVPSWGQYSHAEGINTKARGTASHAENNGSQATGNFSHAEGLNTLANGTGSHAEGNNTSSPGQYSHAEGNTSMASGFVSHSEGVSTVASGGGSHAEGTFSIASGANAHAEGDTTIASGQASHSEGGFTEASGIYSHAGGNESKAYLPSQFARTSGKFINAGDAQYSQLYVRRTTTNATPTELFIDGISTRMIIPSGKTWSFFMDIVGRQVGGSAGTIGTSLSAHIKGVVKNVSGTTSMITSSTIIDQRDPTAGWFYAVTADDGTDSLRITVTGEANKTINWFAIIHLTEVA